MALICGLSVLFFGCAVALYIFVSAYWNSYSIALAKEQEEQRRAQMKERENKRKRRIFGVFSIQTKLA